ncbi:ERAD pathway [Tritrichomonas musculus]|uniref:ERAD pathway n=1 Tax=Tritrichomonas musculus TaxID=1915356 RepID=A0ABR2IEE6_9EUKA
MYDSPLDKKPQLRSDGTLPRTWEDTQISVFTKWVNSKLRERNMEIENVGDGFKDGVKLINLLEILSGKDIGTPWNQKPKDVYQMVNNCDIAVNFIQKVMGIKLVAISGKDIVDKNVKSTLGMIWSVIVTCHLDAIMSEVKQEGQSSKEALLQWCKETTAGYPNVEIQDFSKSWSSGTALCALVNKFVPEVLDYKTLDLNNQDLCVRTALDSLKKLGVNVFLDPSDLVGVQSPDEKAVITQVAEMYRFLTDKNKMDQARARLFKSAEINEAIGRMIRESQGQVRDTLFQMASALRPLITEQHLQYCPLCEQLFRGLVGLYNLLKNATSPEQFQQAQAAIAAAQAEIQRIQAENSQKQASIDSAQQQLQQFEQMKAENEQLKQQLATSQQETQRLQAENAQHQAKIASTEQQIQQIQAEKTQLQNENAQHQAKIQSVEQQMQQIQAEKGQLQAASQDKDQLQAQLQQLQQELQQAKSQNEQLQQEVAQHKSQNEQLQQEVAQARNIQAEALKAQQQASQGQGLDNLISGLKFEYGHGVVKNDSLAFFQYQKAADLGNPEAIFSLARMYDRGHGTREDPVQAANLYQKAAESNHYAAMNNLASIKLLGRAGAKDEPGAAQLFKTAADNGCSSAQCNYAILLDTGRGVNKNPEESYKYLKMAADSGHPKAMNNLAYKYQNGDGTAKDLQEAQRLYDLSAQNGNTVAIFNQGIMLNNEQLAVPYWEKAHHLGDRNATNNLGVAKMDGLCGLQKDETAGAQLIKSAADKQCPEAVMNYSTLLLKSRGGVQQNIRGAMKILRMSANLGQPTAMNNFAVELAQGTNVAKNLPEAVRYLRMASDKGDPIACYNYGLMLTLGIGVDKKPQEAQRYFKFAQSRGITEAEQYIK